MNDTEKETRIGIVISTASVVAAGVPLPYQRRAGQIKARRNSNEQQRAIEAAAARRARRLRKRQK